jgi:hypothetical protein
MVFSNASVLGVSSQGEFLGGTTARYRTVKSLEIRGFIDNRASQTKDEGVSGTVATIKQYIENSSATYDTLEAVTINGFSMGEGKIVSLEFEAGETGKDNQIFYGSYSATIQVFSDGDFNLLLDGGATINDSSTISSFSESFSASLNETDEYYFQHSLSFGIFKKNTADDIVERAKAIAGVIFGETLSSFNLIVGDHYGDYNSIAKKLYTEQYNEVTGEFSFDLSFKLLQESQASYSLVTSHSYDTDANGLVTVTEEGTILPRSAEISVDVNTWLATEISNSYTRSNTVYASYYDYISPNNLALNSKPIDVSRAVGITSSSVSYSAKYTNDEGFSNLDKLIERDIILSSSGSVATVEESGTITYNRPRGRDFDPKTKVTSLSGDSSAILARCTNLYDRCGLSKVLKVFSHKFSFSAVGKKIDYAYSYTDSEDVIASGDIARKKIDSNTEAGVPVIQVAGIPNSEDALVQTPGQSTLGSRQITAEATLRRKNDQNIFYKGGSPYLFGTALETLRQEMLVKAYNVFVENVGVDPLDGQEIYVSEASYSLSSDRKLSSSLTVVFAQQVTLPIYGSPETYYTLSG